MQNSLRVFTTISNFRQVPRGGAEPNKPLPQTEPQPIDADLLTSIGGGKAMWQQTPNNNWGSR